MGGYIGLALAGIELGKRRISNAQRMAKVNKKLGTPWYKQIWETPLASAPFFGEMYIKNREEHLADLQAKARNSAGIGGEAALKKASNATREIMNQQLQQNISTINQDWGMAGRYASGARIKAIGQAQNQNAFNLANVVNSMALQESQFTRNLEEEHAYRQAALEAGQPSRAGQVGDIAATLASLYMQNPEWGKEKIGMGQYAPQTAEPTLPDISGYQVNPNLAPPVNRYTDPEYIQRLLDTPLPSAENFEREPPVGPRKDLLSIFQPSPMDLFSTAGPAKPVSQWTEQDFSSIVTSIPDNNVDFYSDPVNYTQLASAVMYTIINHLDNGNLASLLADYQSTGDIGIVLKWLKENGGVEIGSPTIQGK